MRRGKRIKQAGAENDPMGFVRMVAVSATGKHQRKEVQSGLLAQLLGLLLLRHDEDQDWITGVAEALSRALGGPYRVGTVGAAWEDEVLRRARERLAVELG
ncbi:hypothetical protein KCV87_34460 [Actinosynnema pretiosum subsp. pretiosum]|uniref:Uncharacterized protein n=1 Tax=Actinosynnema pretiosum subsp. pretiosum TaxID=103721 RepID=A0AA45L6Q1_9PSEU|nr:hypothetical protein APASM_4259 [Actinosynnema pretiosum subsp. pretiosum]QUF04356.1 hypothetical protein KCV87_34460 [Actinosynnema pretiosum subsp. pretiosum]